MAFPLRIWILLCVIVLALACLPGSAPPIADRSGGNTRVLLKSVSGVGPDAQYLSREILEGDWVADVDISAAGEPTHAAFLFALQPGTDLHVALHLHPDRAELIRHQKSGVKVLSSLPAPGVPPWRLRVLKRGGYYIFAVNGVYWSFTFHPSGDIEGGGRTRVVTEPTSTSLGVEFPSGGRYELRSVTVRQVSFGRRQADPVVAPGPKDSWYGAEAFPGAVIEHDGIYYLYLNGTDWSSEKLEGGGNTRTGLATSKDLYHWQVDPRGVVLDLGPKGSWDSTLIMVNGATRTPEGKYAVTYMGFDGRTWSGIGLATADHPSGPFTKHPGNPVLRAVPGSGEAMIHEHTLLQDGQTYILFYVGYDARTGDRGCLAISRDLVHWTRDPSNPVFVTEAPNRFDSLHLRPRSLFRHGDYYYLFYEGAGVRPKFSASEGGVEIGNDQLVFDTVGMARTKDLHKWERYPWNPSIPQSGGYGFDSLWAGWPHAVLRPDGVFVLYAASDAWGFAKKQGRVFTGLIHFDYQELESWGSDR